MQTIGYNAFSYCESLDTIAFTQSLSHRRASHSLSAWPQCMAALSAWRVRSVLKCMTCLAARCLSVVLCLPAFMWSLRPVAPRRLWLSSYLPLHLIQGCNSLSKAETCASGMSSLFWRRHRKKIATRCLKLLCLKEICCLYASSVTLCL